MNRRLLSLLAVVILAIIVIIMERTGQFSHWNSSLVKETGLQSAPIDELTEYHRVANYLKQHHRLPDFYITKKQAREQGWNSQKGNLCQVLPGKAIGGDRFSNREQQLPIADGRIWYEADVNYQCGHRGSDRLVFSNDNLIYLTQDHYRHFIPME